MNWNIKNIGRRIILNCKVKMFSVSKDGRVYDQDTRRCLITGGSAIYGEITHRSRGL